MASPVDQQLATYSALPAASESAIALPPSFQKPLDPLLFQMSAHMRTDLLLRMLRFQMKSCLEHNGIAAVATVMHQRQMLKANLTETADISSGSDSHHSAVCSCPLCCMKFAEWCEARFPFKHNLCCQHH